MTEKLPPQDDAAEDAAIIEDHFAGRIDNESEYLGNRNARDDQRIECQDVDGPLVIRTPSTGAMSQASNQTATGDRLAEFTLDIDTTLRQSNELSEKRLSVGMRYTFILSCCILASIVFTPHAGAAITLAVALAVAMGSIVAMSTNQRVTLESYMEAAAKIRTLFNLFRE